MAWLGLGNSVTFGRKESERARSPLCSFDLGVEESFAFPSPSWFGGLLEDLQIESNTHLLIKSVAAESQNKFLMSVLGPKRGIGSSA
jgi:hypothetical protein